MKIRYLSDLHLEFAGYRPDTLPPISEEIVERHYVLVGPNGSDRDAQYVWRDNARNIQYRDVSARYLDPVTDAGARP